MIIVGSRISQREGPLGKVDGVAVALGPARLSGGSGQTKRRLPVTGSVDGSPFGDYRLCVRGGQKVRRFNARFRNPNRLCDIPYCAVLRATRSV
jgi:hypothetical protein